MEAAKAAVARHTSRSGHHTDVQEIVRPAVTQETIKPHRHEIITEAVDREVHQHHHHTTVVPLSHTETLPTKHTHNLIPVKKVHHQHEDKEGTERHLAELAAHFRDISITHPTTHSTEKAAPVIGEHVHHHVHETVQPIIYKETHHREHVHTTIPIHEVHYNKSQHHGMSALPMKQMAEFLEFHKDRSPDHVTHSRFDGPPRAYDSKLNTTFEKLGLLTGHHNSTHTPTPINTTAANSPHANRHSAMSPMTPELMHHNNRTHRRGSDSSLSSASSASSSAPSTPTSPSHRNRMLPKTTTTTTSHHTMGNPSPFTHSTSMRGPNGTMVDTTTTTSHSSHIPVANNNSMIETPATKHANEPVRIASGDESPRASDEVYPNRQRGSFISRLTGGRNSTSNATRRF